MRTVKADLIAAGVTTPWEHEDGMTSFDRLALYANDGKSHCFDCNDADEIIRIIERLAVEAGYTVPEGD